MWRATSVDGTLTYSFAEAVEASYPGYYVRFIGGAIFLTGMLIMAYNVYMTVQGQKRKEQPSPATPMVAPGGGA
jgi:cytochrome c oxidase cbb3-type subunit 1